MFPDKFSLPLPAHIFSTMFRSSPSCTVWMKRLSKNEQIFSLNDTTHSITSAIPLLGPVEQPDMLNLTEQESFTSIKSMTTAALPKRAIKFWKNVSFFTRNPYLCCAISCMSTERFLNSNTITECNKWLGSHLLNVLFSFQVQYPVVTSRNTSHQNMSRSFRCANIGWFMGHIQ